jgi:hypothetical protein
MKAKLDCFRKANAEAGIHVDLAPYKGRDMKGVTLLTSRKKNGVIAQNKSRLKFC